MSPTPFGSFRQCVAGDTSAPTGARLAPNGKLVPLGNGYTRSPLSNHHMNIRSRLIFLVACVLLPAFGAGAISVWYVYAEEQRAQERTLSEAARVLAQLIDNELKSSARFLTALSASPDLAAGDLERFYEQAKTLSFGGRNTIVLSTPEGAQLLNTRLPPHAPARTINPRLIELRKAADPQATVVSDLFFSPLGQRYDFAVQEPVVVNGTLRYYMSRGIQAQEMQRFLAAQGFPPNWITSVVDRAGTVIARNADSEQFIGKSATGELAAKIRAGVQHGLNDGVSLDGKHVRAFFHRAPMSGWTVILSVPVSELNEPAMHASLLLTGLILLTLLGALGLTQRYLHKILRPIERLRDDAERLRRGVPVTPFASGLAELDEVNATLAGASSELLAAKANMERRVAEAIESTERVQRVLLHSQKLEALGRLTGGVAHDFNNVLQTLTSALQLIALESNPSKIPARIAVCTKAVNRAAMLVAQLRAFGRAQDVYLQTVNAGEAIVSALPMLTNSLPSAITLETRIAPDTWPITVDPTQFELALLNLVLNARDAIAGAGSIRIHVDNCSADGAEDAPQGDCVLIEVIDTGVGMPPELLAKAFDPFFTTKPVDQGSGLGLPQAYGFAVQSGGSLTLSSQVGSGTRACVRLPRARGGTSDKPAQPERAAARQATPTTLDAVVLFVEDDTLVRDSVTPILEQSGATVVCASSGDEALRILEAGRHVDILFTDIVMPGKLNGVLLARHVRAHFPAIALVLATGYFDEKFDVADATLLTKPYDAATLVDLLATLTGRQPVG
jgi:signal transduction histidine kinase